MNKNQGIAPILIILIVVSVLAAAGGVIYYYQKQKLAPRKSQIQEATTQSKPQSRNNELGNNKVTCEYKKGEYEMRVYDSEGRATGLFNGKIKQEISRSLFIAGEVTIFQPQETYYEYELYAVKEGNYQLKPTSTVNGKESNFNIINIPIFPGQTHRYKIDWKLLEEGKDGVTLLVDNDKDGKFEKTISVSGTEFTCEEFLEQIN